MLKMEMYRFTGRCGEGELAKIATTFSTNPSYSRREGEFLNTCKQKYYSVLFLQQLLKVQHIYPFYCHYQTFHFFVSICTTIQNRKANLLTLAALEIELGEFKPTSWPRIRFTSSVPFALGTPTVNLKLY